MLEQPWAEWSPSGLSDGGLDGHGAVLLARTWPSTSKSRPAASASSASERALGARAGLSSVQPVGGAQAYVGAPTPMLVVVPSWVVRTSPKARTRRPAGS